MHSVSLEAERERSERTYAMATKTGTPLVLWYFFSRLHGEGER